MTGGRIRRACTRVVSSGGTLPSHVDSAAVVHVELHRMSAHAEARHFLELQADVSVDHVVGEHTTAGEELPVLVELLDCHVERMADLRNMLFLLRLEVVEVLVRG